MYLFILFVINSEFSLILSPIVALNKTRSIVATEDATIRAQDPTSNFGGNPELQIGYELDWLEAFIKFDLLSAPKDFKKAVLKLEWTYLSIIIVLEIYQTSTNWSEYSITWDNAPQERISITSGIVDYNGILRYEITEVLLEDQDSCSICLTSFTSHWIYIASRECSSEYNPPRVIFHFDDNALPSIFLSIVIGLVASCILGLILYQIYYKK